MIEHDLSEIGQHFFYRVWMEEASFVVNSVPLKSSKPKDMQATVLHQNQHTGDTAVG